VPKKWVLLDNTFMKYEQYTQEARKFVREVATELGEPDNIDQADRIMVSVLHALRDLLTPEESLHFVSQLPMLLKATYVNGWRLATKNRIRSMNEFIECLKKKNPRTVSQDFGNDEIAIERAKAVFKVLRNHITIGEVRDIVAQLPAELTELWPVPDENRERHSVESH
jgi:uncharacterized protein (DUF2267 family)